MSCYIVSDATIDAIVHGLASYGEGEYANRFDWLGAQLLAVNYASVNARYGEDTEAPAYRYTYRHGLTYGHILGAVNCWRYQACEAPGFDGSEFDLATLRLIGRLAELMAHELGYPVPWGIDDEDLPQAV